ncbi:MULTISPECIES: hypothetical protein, partial [unclassified Methylobacterium]|uniref:hypothetical protein n=1 Tax=unclassified Methylobacterium TaxID=2615210 RepID=UPI00195534DB
NSNSTFSRNKEAKMFIYELELFVFLLGRDAPRAAAGDGGRDGYVLPRVGLRIHSSPQELIGSNSWSGE